jgi:transposase
MKQVNQVGVDVDSEALVCAMQRAGQRLPLARFANTAAGHKQFIRWTSKGGRPVRVCLEATGIYSLQFALALHHAKKVEVMVVNPRAIKDFFPGVHAAGQDRRRRRWRHFGLSRTHAVYRVATTGAGDSGAAVN